MIGSRRTDNLASFSIMETDNAILKSRSSQPVALKSPLVDRQCGETRDLTHLSAVAVIIFVFDSPLA